MENIRKTILKRKINDVVYNLYSRTSADIVIYENTTVADKLSEIDEILETVLSSEDIDEKIKNATNNLYNKIMGITDEDRTTVDEAYDTLKEVANYLKEHGDVVKGILANISTLEETVGDDTKGLLKKVTDIENNINSLNLYKVEQSDINGKLKVNGEDITVYTEPESIDASKIVQDTDHRFLTDKQIEKLNSQSDKINVVNVLPEDINESDLYLVICD